jgi:hypothetical protein
MPTSLDFTTIELIDEISIDSLKRKLEEANLPDSFQKICLQAAHELARDLEQSDSLWRYRTVRADGSAGGAFGLVAMREGQIVGFRQVAMT